MNDNLDDFLNSLGIESTAPAVATSVDTQNQAVDAGPAPVSEGPQTLSNEDFDDILEEYGFGRPQDAEAEEIADEESREEEDNTMDYDENAGESRDLDVEEDADWQERIDSGEINPQEVHFHLPDGEVIDVPIIHEEATAEEQTPSAPAEEPLVPLNSPTLLLDESTTRFSGAEWFRTIQNTKIILAGVGGIGRI